MQGFWFGVITSFVGTVVFEVIRRTASVSFYPYPDIKGEWEGEYEIRGKKGKELIRIEQQFWRWCKGTFIWTNPDDSSDTLNYRFSGKFIYTNTVLGCFRSTTRRCLDDGVFIIRVDYDTQNGTGGSVSIDHKTNEPTSSTYRIRRLREK